MRTAILLIVFLAILGAAASASTTSTNMRGTQPAVSGNIVAFLTFEDAVDTDLNGDNDMSDHVLQYYDIAEGKVINTGNVATRITLAGKLLAYEDKTRAIQIYDIEHKDNGSMHERGTAPSAHGKIIAFMTSEKDEDTDLNGDNDKIDEIVQYYDADTETTTNLGAVGTEPLVLSDYLAFTTREDAIDEDLNNDGDRDDSVIRYYSFDNDKIVDTRLTGEHPAGYKLETIIVSENQKFWSVNLDTMEKKDLGVFGNNPSLYQDLLAHDRDGTIVLYRLSTAVEKTIGKGTEPALLGNTLAYAGEDGTITILQGQDPDQDTVPDFADNCPDQANENQSDADKDGIGDACDDTPLPEAKEPEPAQAPPITANIAEPESAPPVTVEAAALPAEPVFTTQSETLVPPAPVERKAIPETMVLQKEKEGHKPTYWFLVAVGLTVVGILLYFFVPRWMQKRRKSFGF